MKLYFYYGRPEIAIHIDVREYFSLYAERQINSQSEKENWKKGVGKRIGL